MVHLLFSNITVEYYLLDGSSERQKNLPVTYSATVEPSDPKPSSLFTMLSTFNKVLILFKQTFFSKHYSNKQTWGTPYTMKIEVVFIHKSEKKCSKLTTYIYPNPQNVQYQECRTPRM